jgi:hypothetical protein
MVNLGLILGAVGALMLAIGAARFLRDPSNETAGSQRWWTFIGAISVGVGFIAQLVGRLGN